ncbi:MAG: Ig-like domain repeat protein [Nitrososphaerota archaeon]
MDSTPTLKVYHKQDSWVIDFYPDTNMGSAPNLDVGGDTINRRERTLIQFDLPAFKPGVVINSAKLYEYHYLYSYDPGTLTIAVHRLLSPWSESTVTWNNQPPHDPTVEASLTKTAGDFGYWVWDITNLVKKWIFEGSPNYGLILICTAYTGTYGSVSFTSKENQLWPHGYLLIDYTPIPTTLTLSAEKTSVPVGSDIILKGSLTNTNTGEGIGGETVTLQEYVNGQWVDKATTTTNPLGAFSFTLSGYPIGSYTFRAVYAGSLSYAGSTSPQVTVTVTKIPTSLSIESDKVGYLVGETAKFSGFLKRADTNEGLPGKTILLQKLVGTTWTNVGSGQTETDGFYIILYPLNESGSFSFRSTFEGDETSAPATSSTLDITVDKVPTALTLTPSKTAARVGETVTFSGTLYRSDTLAGIGGETVWLQKLIETVWTNIRSTTTLSDGSYTFSETFSEAGVFSYRVSYFGSAVYQPSNSPSTVITVTKIPTSLSLMADKLKTVVDGIINFTGKLTNLDTGAGVGGQTIKLQQLIGGTWTTILTGSTASDGTVTFSRAMGAVGDFSFRLAYDGTSMYEGSVSDVLTVSVIKIPTVLTFTANITNVYVGGEVQFLGSLIRGDTGEGVPDQVIELQKLQDAAWTTVMTRRTASDGTYTFYVPFDAEGTFRFKAYFSGSDKYEPSDTTPIDITAVMPEIPTVLTFQASSLTAREGESIVFSGYLRTEALEPVANADIILQELREEQWIKVALAKTDERGFYSIIYRFTTRGVYTFRTVFEGAAPYGPSSSTPITVTIFPPVEKVRPRRVVMRLDVDKKSITLGETIRFWGNLGFTSVMRTIPLPFQTVRVKVDKTEIATLRTSITGAFEGEWKPGTTGSFDLYAEGLTRFLGIKIGESNHIMVTVA